MNILFAFFAWSFVALGLYWAVQGLKDGLDHLENLHKIQCSSCLYHTHCSVLKCTIHPHLARTEAAIRCPDYDGSSELI